MERSVLHLSSPGCRLAELTKDSMQTLLDGSTAAAAATKLMKEEFSKLGAGQPKANFDKSIKDLPLGIAPSPYGQEKLVASQHDTLVILKRIERDCLFCYREYRERKGRRSTASNLGKAGRT